MHVECRLGLLAGERVTAAAGSGSGDVLSGGIDAGRVDELTAARGVYTRGWVSQGWGIPRENDQGDGALWGNNRFQGDWIDGGFL